MGGLASPPRPASPPAAAAGDAGAPPPQRREPDGDGPAGHAWEPRLDAGAAPSPPKSHPLDGVGAAGAPYGSLMEQLQALQMSAYAGPPAPPPAAPVPAPALGGGAPLDALHHHRLVAGGSQPGSLSSSPGLPLPAALPLDGAAAAAAAAAVPPLPYVAPPAGLPGPPFAGAGADALLALQLELQLQMVRASLSNASSAELPPGFGPGGGGAGPPGGGAPPPPGAAPAAPRRAGGRADPAAQREKVRRTVYITDIDSAVSEAELAAFFAPCGPAVDVRVCGDPNSALRFAFIEFAGEDGARAALARAGARLGAHALRVSPSKTAIVPVNGQFLPRSAGEREAAARTVYVANIDRAVERDALRAFLQNLCGDVARVRLLGDAAHNTKIAFVEFAAPEAAAAALRLSGALLGALPLRIAPSKTPVRDARQRG